MAGLLIAWWLSGWVYDRSQDVPALSDSMEALRRIHIRPHALRHALRFPGEAFAQIPVGWTLRVEMIYSLLLPFMAAIALRWHWGLLVAASIPAFLLDPSDATFFRYAIDFSLGIAIHCERERLEAFFHRAARGLRAALLVGGLAALSLPGFLMIVGSDPKTTDALHALGAAALVAGAIHAPALQRSLSAPPLAWLGKISYSVYLIHVPVIILLTPHLHERLGFWQGSAFVAVCFAATLLVAPFLYHFVEVPSMRFGYALHGWLKLDAREASGAR